MDEAWPGDIIGIPNHGVLRVGDTLSESGNVVFTGIPNFAPEILRRVRLGDPMKQKHLARALESLAEEGVTQVFKPMIGAQWMVGVVGNLQLDVLKSRLRAEYGLDADLEAVALRHRALDHAAAKPISRNSAPPIAARWRRTATARRCSSRRAAGSWAMSADKFPNIKFAKTRERSDVHAEG